MLVRHVGAAFVVFVATVFHSLQLLGAELDVAQRAYEVLKPNCYGCHGYELSYDDLDVLDHAILTAGKGQGRDRYVEPGNPERSRLWQQVRTDLMPKGGPPLSDADKGVLRKWIEQGAPAWAPPDAERPFISNSEVFQTVLQHLQGQRPEVRESLRFFSLTNLHNNRKVSGVDLRLYRAALAKAVNAMSRKEALVIPQAIDKHQTIFVIHLADVGWQGVVWKKILEKYPYGIEPTEKQGFESYQEIEELLGQAKFDGIPVIRADWFVATATRPPLYHALVGTPRTLAELEKEMQADPIGDFKSNGTVRGGVIQSGVSGQNRVADYIPSASRMLWISYDFFKNSLNSNVIRFPLGPLFEGHPHRDRAFVHAGSEIIYELPNGMHAYLLVDKDGKRIDTGPIEIVWDRGETSGSPQIVNGISCIGCHKHGMMEFSDVVGTGHAVFDAEIGQKIQRLYNEKKLKTQLAVDRDRYLQVLKKVIGPRLQQGDDAGKKIEEFPEPITALARRYRKDLSLHDVAAEIGHPGEERLGDSISENLHLKSLGLEPLVHGKALKRSMWDSQDEFASPFQEAARELRFGIPVNSN